MFNSNLSKGLAIFRRGDRREKTVYCTNFSIKSWVSSQARPLGILESNAAVDHGIYNPIFLFPVTSPLDPTSVRDFCPVTKKSSTSNQADSSDIDVS